MPPQLIFLMHLVRGYAACLLCFGTYIFPKLRSMDHFNAQRVIATIHSFRFFGLVFILPGVVGAELPRNFAVSAAYGDFATGLLAIFALLAVRRRPLFRLFCAAFNILGAIDISIAYYHAIRVGLPNVAGQLGAAYIIPIIYVPMLVITHAVALYWLVRPQSRAIQQIAGNAVTT